MVGTADRVLIREVSLIQSVLYGKVSLYACMCTHMYYYTLHTHTCFVQLICFYLQYMHLCGTLSDLCIVSTVQYSLCTRLYMQLHTVLYCTVLYCTVLYVTEQSSRPIECSARACSVVTDVGCCMLPQTMWRVMAHLRAFSQWHRTVWRTTSTSTLHS